MFYNLLLLLASTAALSAPPYTHIQGYTGEESISLLVTQANQLNDIYDRILLTSDVEVRSRLIRELVTTDLGSIHWVFQARLLVRLTHSRFGAPIQQLARDALREFGAAHQGILDCGLVVESF